MPNAKSIIRAVWSATIPCEYAPDLDYEYVEDPAKALPTEYRQILMLVLQAVWHSYRKQSDSESQDFSYSQTEESLVDSYEAISSNNVWSTGRKYDDSICESPEQIRLVGFILYDEPNKWGHNLWIRFTYNRWGSLSDWGINTNNNEFSCYQD